MYTRDDISLHRDIDLAVIKTTTDGAGLATAGYDSVNVYYITGTWTDGTHTPALQESADGTNWTAVAAGDMEGSFTAVSSAAGQNAVQQVKYIGDQPHVRVAVTVTGSPVTGLAQGVYMVAGMARKLPAAASV